MFCVSCIHLHDAWILVTEHVYLSVIIILNLSEASEFVENKNNNFVKYMTAIYTYSNMHARCF